MVDKKLKVFDDGLCELTEEAKQDLHSSGYYNDDLAPVTKKNRSWNTYNIATLWMGMCIAISTWMLASSGIALGLSCWQSIANVLVANLILLVPMQLNSHAGTKYGISFPIFARLSFGIRGSHFASIARAIVGAMWYGIQCWLGGEALNVVFTAVIPGWANIANNVWIAYIIFFLLCTLVAYAGDKYIKFMEGWCVPVLCVLMIALCVWALIAVGDAGKRISDIFNMPATYAEGDFWKVFLPCLTGNIGFWATMSLNIPDFSRFAKSQKTQFAGQVIGLPTTMTLIAFASVLVTGATIIVFGEALWDPTNVIVAIDKPWVSVLGCLGIFMAQITTNVAANIVAPANGFSNLFPKKISYKTGVLIGAVISVLIMPWRLMSSASSYIYDFLGTYAVYLGPIAGIYIADYYIVKKRRIDVYDLYRGEGSRYWYENGFNRRSFVVWALCVLPPTIGLIFPSATLFKTIFDNGWLFGFIVSIILYPLFMRNYKGSLVSEDEMKGFSVKA